MTEAMYDLLYIIQVVSDCMLSMSVMMYVMWFVMEKK